MNDKTTQIEPELPELPKYLVAIDQNDDEFWGEIQEHAWDSDYADELKLNAPLFTAGQVRAYALSAIAADRNKRDGCDQCGSKRAVGNPLYCNACHAAFSTHPADAKASVSATGTIARSLPEW